MINKRTIIVLIVGMVIGFVVIRIISNSNTQVTPVIISTGLTIQGLNNDINIKEYEVILSKMAYKTAYEEWQMDVSQLHFLYDKKKDLMSGATTDFITTK